MKNICFLLTWFLLPASYSQTIYNCEYRETLTKGLSDSTKDAFRKAAADKGLPPELVEMMSDADQEIIDTYDRFVVASPDSTNITIASTRKQEGVIILPQWLVLIKNTFYEITLFKRAVMETQPHSKDFTRTGKTRRIQLYDCDEYLSADSTCKIWVTTSLPSYINPGIQVNNVNGAIFGFEIKTNGLIRRVFMSKLGN